MCVDKIQADRPCVRISCASIPFVLTPVYTSEAVTTGGRAVATARKSPNSSQIEKISAQECVTRPRPQEGAAEI